MEAIYSIALSSLNILYINHLLHWQSVTTTACLHPLYLLFLFFFFQLSAATPQLISITDNQTDIHEVIPTYGLPPGLIPGNVKSYTLQDSGSFTVTLNSECYVHFDNLVYYGTDIRGKLSYGAVHEASGIQVKKAFFWFTVNGIEARHNGTSIRFNVGPFTKTYPASRFAELPVCESKSSLRSLLFDV